jgi:hypothetical protein
MGAGSRACRYLRTVYRVRRASAPSGLCTLEFQPVIGLNRYTPGRRLGSGPDAIVSSSGGLRGACHPPPAPAVLGQASVCECPPPFSSLVVIDGRACG